MKEFSSEGNVRSFYDKRRLLQTCDFSLVEKKQRKRKNATISSKIVKDPNVYGIAEAHKFKLTQAIIQMEIAPQN